jgi:hypothetical protein
MVRSGMAINLLFLACLTATCVYAWAAGGAPERIGAALFAGGSIITFVTVSAVPIRFRDVEIGVFVVDVVTFLAFVLLALRANRFWPLWVSALLGLGVVSHLAILLHPRVIPWAYAVVLSIWSYPILLTIALGTLRHRQRRIANGADPSWTPSSARAGRTAPPSGRTR